jgi:hypothetical protein
MIDQTRPAAARACGRGKDCACSDCQCSNCGC